MPSSSRHAPRTSEECHTLIQLLEPKCQRTYTPTGAVIASSEGSYHFTPEGRRLADFTSGVLVANLGHNPLRWWRRVLQYMGLDQLPTYGDFAKAAPLTSYNAVTELEAEASRRLIASLRSQPGGQRMEKVLWAASGSEAVHKAIVAALAQREGADVILATRHGFHGKKGLAGAVTGSEQDAHRDPRVHFVSFPQRECFSVDLRREPIDLEPYLSELDDASRKFGNRIACLITEPYLGGGGSYHPQFEYLQLLERFCRDHGALFILDEVQSNFGRTGAMYAYSTYGVQPDLVVLGKGMGNGIPVDAVAGSAEVLDKLAYGEGSDTWSGHPLGCAAVLATLDEFESTDVLLNAHDLAGELEVGLARLAQTAAVEAVRGEGTVWGVHCAPLNAMSPRDTANALIAACYHGDASGRAVHLLGPLADCVIRVAPPLTMAPSEAREYLATMYTLAEQLSRDYAL